MRAFILPAAMLFAGVAAAQEAAKPSITAEEIIEKSIKAGGGREAIAKIKSRVMKGTMELTFAPVTPAIEIWAKAPNKQLILQNIEGFGMVRIGYDGKTGWADDPQNGLREVSGEELDQRKLQAEFNQELRWQELYSKVELKGKEKLNDKDAWVLIFTPKSGKPSTHYYDAATFQMLRVTATAATPQGAMDVTTDLSDYRQVDGITVPFQIKNSMPMGETILRLTEVKHNVEIEDAKFAKPAQ